MPAQPSASRFGQRRTPAAPLPSQSPLASWARKPETGLRATWLGHSTVMLEVGAFHEGWGDIHLGPEHALDATQLLDGGKFLPVPWARHDSARIQTT